MPETPSQTSAQNVDLSYVRSRALHVAEWLLGIAALGCFLIAGNVYLTFVERWLTLVERCAAALGVHVDPTGPNWILLIGIATAAAIPMLALFAGMRWYKRIWRRKLEAVWPTMPRREYLRLHAIRPLANEQELLKRANYLGALLESPAWRHLPVENETAALMARDAKAYRVVSQKLFHEIESDVRNRALVAGLAVGISRNRFLDVATIASSAMELQLHVLTQLGKRPSLRTWSLLWKRTAASLFVNTYLSREDCYAVRVAMTKIVLGLDVASDALASAGEALIDIDLDGVLPDIGGVPLHSIAEIGSSVVGHSFTIGADGVKRIGNLVERSGTDILEGVLAGGILYFHGISLAADCLALDQEHRASDELNRTARAAVFGICVGAAEVVQTHVRAVRQMLRERRRRAMNLGVSTLKRGTKSAAGRMGKWIRRSDQAGPPSAEELDSTETEPGSADPCTTAETPTRWWRRRPGV